MLKAAVIGVGHLGRFHAEKYAIIENVELVGVVDIDMQRAESIASALGVPPHKTLDEVIGRIDVASVVVPTRDHYEVSRALLDKGIHVLVEKPVTRSLEEAESLIELADRRGLVLQVGHMERFNPAMTAAAPHVGRPLFIESSRIIPFPDRNADVDVVLDLMIHDIDITLHLIGGEPKWVHAVGVPVLTPRIDMASARLEFESGCVANLTASRASVKSERKFRIFQHDSYISIDFGLKKVGFAHRIPPEDSGLPDIRIQDLDVTSHDALEYEIRSFLNAVESGDSPVVSGEDGRRALAVALRINSDIQARQGAWLDGVAGT